MTPEEIIESKLIASFMDIDVREFSWRDSNFLIIKDSFPDIEIVNYRASWELLMPVVEKIETIQLPSPSMIPVSVEIKKNSCRIFKGEWNEDKEGFISFVSYSGNEIQYTKIEATYLAVVEFLKWYNKQQNK